MNLTGKMMNLKIELIKIIYTKFNKIYVADEALM